MKIFIHYDPFKPSLNQNYYLRLHFKKRIYSDNCENNLKNNKINYYKSDNKK